MAKVVVAVLVGLFVVGCGDNKPPRPAATPGSDAPAASDPCASCTTGQRCVQRFDGTCRASIECVTTTLSCATNTCSAECEAALCPRPYQCANRPPCGTEAPTAFTCYGP